MEPWHIKQYVKDANIKKQLVTALIVAALPIMAPAQNYQPQGQKQPTADNDHSGYYIEAGLGTLMANVDSNDKLDYHSFSGGLGGIASIGYQFNKHFGVEILGIFSHFSADGTDNSEPAHYNLDGFIVGPDLKGIFTIGRHIAFNLKLGVGYLKAYGTEKKNGKITNNNYSNDYILPFDSIGLSYAIDRHLDFGVSYQGFLLVMANAGVLSGNLTFHF